MNAALAGNGMLPLCRWPLRNLNHAQPLTRLWLLHWVILYLVVGNMFLRLPVGFIVTHSFGLHAPGCPGKLEITCRRSSAHTLLRITFGFWTEVSKTDRVLELRLHLLLLTSLAATLWGVAQPLSQLPAPTPTWPVKSRAQLSVATGLNVLASLLGCSRVIHHSVSHTRSLHSASSAPLPLSDSLHQLGGVCRPRVIFVSY